MKTFKAKNRILPWFLIGLIVIIATGCPRPDPGPDEDPDPDLNESGWVKHPDCILAGTPGSWDESGILGSSVLFVNNVYHMWYGGLKANAQTTHFAIGHATSPDGLTWTKDPANPVLEKGPSGSWDETWVYFPVVVKVGSTFHMWYTGRSLDQVERVGYATSPDGVAWTKQSDNPVLATSTPGQWEGAHVATGPVLYRDNKFHIWYGGSPDGIAFKVGYATSSDGINWTRHAGNPVLDYGNINTWDFPRAQAGSVIFNGTLYEMWYSGGVFDLWSIGHVTSHDGITWERDPLNPILSAGTGWDRHYVAFPSVLPGTGTKLRMWYTSTRATHGSGVGIGYAEKQ